VLGELRRHFRPELLNRIDDMIVFRPLSQEQLRRIVGTAARAVAPDAGGARHRACASPPRPRSHIAEAGYEPAFGARPLKRAIQRLVQNPLAMMLLEGRFGDGDEVLVDLDTGAGQLRFETVRRGQAPDSVAAASEAGV
jgi:ATP-dependent Clp protease ATP-binding subunit ClpB